MSRPDMVDLYLAAGGSRLLNRDRATELGIGLDRVDRVFTYRLLYADVNGRGFQSRQWLADQLNLPRQRIEEADAVAEASGLLINTGQRRERSIVWQYLPVQLAEQAAISDPEDTDEPPPVARGVARGVARRVARGVARDPVQEGKGREEGGVQTVTQPPLMQPQPDPDACPKHPRGWHHDEACGKCAEWKRADAEKRAQPPVVADVFAALDESTWCDHDNPPGRCPECRRHVNTRRATA